MLETITKMFIIWSLLIMYAVPKVSTKPTVKTTLKPTVIPTVKPTVNDSKLISLINSEEARSKRQLQLFDLIHQAIERYANCANEHLAPLKALANYKQYETFTYRDGDLQTLSQPIVATDHKCPLINLCHIYEQPQQQLQQQSPQILHETAPRLPMLPTRKSDNLQENYQYSMPAYDSNRFRLTPYIYNPLYPQYVPRERNGFAAVPLNRTLYNLLYSKLMGQIKQESKSETLSHLQNSEEIEKAATPDEKHHETLLGSIHDDASLATTETQNSICYTPKPDPLSVETTEKEATTQDDATTVTTTTTTTASIPINGKELDTVLGSMPHFHSSTNSNPSKYSCLQLTTIKSTPSEPNVEQWTTITATPKDGEEHETLLGSRHEIETSTTTETPPGYNLKVNTSSESVASESNDEHCKSIASNTQNNIILMATNPGYSCQIQTSQTCPTQNVHPTGNQNLNLLFLQLDVTAHDESKTNLRKILKKLKDIKATIKATEYATKLETNTVASARNEGINELPKHTTSPTTTTNLATSKEEDTTSEAPIIGAFLLGTSSKEPELSKTAMEVEKSNPESSQKDNIVAARKEELLSKSSLFAAEENKNDLEVSALVATGLESSTQISKQFTKEMIQFKLQSTKQSSEDGNSEDVDNSQEQFTNQLSFATSQRSKSSQGKQTPIGSQIKATLNDHDGITPPAAKSNKTNFLSSMATQKRPQAPPKFPPAEEVDGFEIRKIVSHKNSKTFSTCDPTNTVTQSNVRKLSSKHRSKNLSFLRVKSNNSPKSNPKHNKNSSITIAISNNGKFKKIQVENQSSTSTSLNFGHSSADIMNPSRSTTAKETNNGYINILKQPNGHAPYEEPIVSEIYPDKHYKYESKPPLSIYWHRIEEKPTNYKKISTGVSKIVAAKDYDNNHDSDEVESEDYGPPLSKECEDYEDLLETDDYRNKDDTLKPRVTNSYKLNSYYS